MGRSRSLLVPACFVAFFALFRGRGAYADECVYVAASPVSIINTESDTVTATVPVGADPFDVALTANGARAYVTNSGSNSVSVIDSTTRNVIDTLPANIPRG